ncbi:MAG: hypothetical protein ACTHK4_02155, partial [Mycobacteriales bacterium]
MRTRVLGAVLALLAGCIAAVVLPGTAPRAAAAASGLRIVVLSGKPAWIAGPQVLVAVVVPTAGDLAGVHVTLDQRDVK